MYGLEREPGPKWSKERLTGCPECSAWIHNQQKSQTVRPSDLKTGLRRERLRERKKVIGSRKERELQGGKMGRERERKRESYRKA